MPERYRIDFSIQRAEDGSEEYVEIGFGGSTDESTIDAALYSIESIIQRREYDKSFGAPDV